MFDSCHDDNLTKNIRSAIQLCLFAKWNIVETSTRRRLFFFFFYRDDFSVSVWKRAWIHFCCSVAFSDEELNRLRLMKVRGFWSFFPLVKPSLALNLLAAVFYEAITVIAFYISLPLSPNSVTSFEHLHFFGSDFAWWSWLLPESLVDSAD